MPRPPGRGTTWLAHLAAPTDLARDSGPGPIDPIDLMAARGIIANMVRAGRPGKFTELVAHTRSGLLATDATSYEAALVNLGILAGASEWKGNLGATAAPDATWIFESEI